MIRLFLLTILLSGCTISADPSIVFERQHLPYPAVESFTHCRSYGCSKTDIITLTNAEQNLIRNLMPTAQDAETERKNIKKAVAQFEKIAGKKTGTSEDIAGTYVRLGSFQQDCIDESTNTTTYLILLNQMGLLQFHDVNALTSRPPILSGRLGPHRTAVITERTTGIKYAVDSWFHNNGEEPEIVKLDKWKRGWHPAKHEQ